MFIKTFILKTDRCFHQGSSSMLAEEHTQTSKSPNSPVNICGHLQQEYVWLLQFFRDCSLFSSLFVILYKAIDLHQSSDAESLQEVLRLHKWSFS